MARKQKKADNAAVTLLKGLLAGLVEAAEDGDEEATAIIEEAGLSLGGESADADADEDDDDDDDDDAEEEGEDDYSEMSLKELRALAKERGIKVPRGSKEDDIIDLLEEADEEGDEDEDDDADEDDDGEDDYSEMSLKELRALAKERGIKLPRGSKEDDIIDLLEEADEEGDDEDDDDDAEEDVDYSEMSLKELKAECKAQGIKVPRGADEEELIELLEGDTDDDDDDDADEDEDDDIPDLDEMDDKELIKLAKEKGLKGRANADKAYDFLADHYGLEEEDEDADDADEDEDDWDDED